MESSQGENPAIATEFLLKITLLEQSATRVAATTRLTIMLIITILILTTAAVGIAGYTMIEQHRHNAQMANRLRTLEASLIRAQTQLQNLTEDPSEAKASALAGNQTLTATDKMLSDVLGTPQK